MNKPRYTHLVFDLLGVIFSEGHIMTKAFIPLLDPSLSEDAKDSIIKTYNLFTIGQVEEPEFWKVVEPYLPKPVVDFRREYFDSLQLDPQAKEIIPELAKNFELGIISNIANEWWLFLQEKFPFDRYFTTIITSGQQGYAKPDPRLYEDWLADSHAVATNILYTDDQKKWLEPAGALGMNVVWMNKNNPGNKVAASRESIANWQEFKQFVAKSKQDVAD